MIYLFPRSTTRKGIAWSPWEWGVGTDARPKKYYPHPWGYSSGPGGTRTRGFFSAIDEQVGEKGKKVVYYIYFDPK